MKRGINAGIVTMCEPSFCLAQHSLSASRHFRGKCNTALSKEIMNLMQKVFLYQSFKLCHEKRESLWLLICTQSKAVVGGFVVSINI